MSAEGWLRAARARATASFFAVGLAIVVVAAALGWRVSGAGLAAGVAVLGVALVGAAAWRRAQRFGRGWLVRRLDADRREIEDSADLLFADLASLGPLQRLQRERVTARLAAAMPDLRPAVPVRAIAIAWTLAAIAVAAVMLWPRSEGEAALAPSREGAGAAPGVPALVGQRLRVVPPGYTGLPARDLPVLDAKAPQGSVLQWTLAFTPATDAAALRFLDGRRVPLRREGGRWTARLRLDRSGLYRVVAAGGRGVPPLHRVEAVADRPPTVSVRAPGRTLTIATPGQRRWALLFEAQDDFGVAPAAALRVTVAAGAGEQVTFRERTLTLRGTGPARQRRFAASLDPVALGLDGPGDLVAQLTVSDTRTPGPQAARSASLILRRPAPRPEASAGLDAGVRAALPAYLRSQRQVIIDAESLIRRRRSLSAADFLKASIAIGADQEALRGRYGQFLGGENEEKALPVGETPAVAGRAEDVLAEYGHAHDEGEAATLFDPATRERLKNAVDQMWQSEGALKAGEPARALPFANRALVLIKQVQQATRVFLARVGSELPPIDPTRRLTGKRDDLGPAALSLPARMGSEAAAARAWAAVDGQPGAAGVPAGAMTGVGIGAGVDPLALAAARDAVRRDPACETCRERLRALVWRGLPRPPPVPTRRAAGDAAGLRYLDAIGAR